MDESSELKELAKLAADLVAAGEDVDAAVKVAQEIDARVGALPESARKKLLEQPAVKNLLAQALEPYEKAKGNAEEPPGSYIYRVVNGNRVPAGKKPWTLQWLNTRYPTKTWRNVDRQITLGFMGIMVTLRPRQEVTLPEPFHGVWERWLIDQDLANEHAEYMFKKRDRVSDPSILSPSSNLVRETATGHNGEANTYVPGGGVPAFGPASAAGSASGQ